MEPDGAVNALPGWENFPDTQVPLSLSSSGMHWGWDIVSNQLWQVLPLCCPTPQPPPQALPLPHVIVKSFNNHVLFAGAGTWSKKRDAPRHLDHMINLDLDIDLDHMINKLKMTKPNIYSSAQTCSLPPQNSTHEAFLIISSGKSKLD